MGHMPVGGGGTLREKPKPGAFNAYLHGIWYIGLHSKTWQGNTKQVHQGLAVFEIDQIDSTGKRFDVCKRLTWSVHEKSVIRTRYGPIFYPQSFAWGDDKWAEANIGIVDNERDEGYMHGPCMVSMDDKANDGSVINTYLKAIGPMQQGGEPLAPNFDYSLDIPGLAKWLRGQVEDKTCPSLLEPFNPAMFAEPIPQKRNDAEHEKAEMGAKNVDPEYPDKSAFADQF